MISTGSLVRKRILVCMALFLALFLLLTGRLFYLQVVRARALQSRAQAQWTSESVIAPNRGAIVDRNGNALAMSATAYIASVSPRQVRDPAAFARILAPVLDMDEETIRRRAADTSRGGVTLKRQLDREVAQQLRAMYAEHRAARTGLLDGLYLEEDARRYYPMGAFASQLLGLTSVDGSGQSGLEASLDAWLSGRAGATLEEIDGKGRSLAYGQKEYVPAVDGGTARLTIDYVIQSFAEEAAREAIAVNNARGVRVIVMRPDTGEILALCAKPDYDPNDPPRSDAALLAELMRNRLIADAYEPGSTFKIITTATALELGVTHVNEGFYCAGSTVVDGSRIRCWSKPHGAQSLAQGLCNSCNPVFVELGLRIGADRFYNSLRSFGLGSLTGVDIPGEAGGILISRENVKRVDLARIGFGQSVALTPIQLITACCAVVNGGRLMKPYVVAEITDRAGEVVEKNEPTVVNRPIGEATSRTMRALLENVVANGGGRNAYLEGWHVGGKTGTAQVYKDGAVSTYTHIGSFIGFAPMDDPQVAVLVVVDEARVGIDYGSVTAAPFARDILEKTLSYLGVPRETGETDALAMVAVPDVTGLTVKEAAQSLKEAGLQYLLDSAGERVAGQMPAAGAQMKEKSIVMLYADGEVLPDGEGYAQVPDVAGLSISAANRLIVSSGLTMRISGSGVAVEQSPAPGERVLPTTPVTVRFMSPGGGEDE